MAIFFPVEVWRIIYSYDSTYVEIMQKDVMSEFSQMAYSISCIYDRSCTIRNFYLPWAIPPRYYDSETKQICGHYIFGKTFSNSPIEFR
jgi:hypothetical protein